MQLTLKIRDVIAATPRARIVRLDLDGNSFPYRAGQAVLLSGLNGSRRSAYSLAAAPHDASREDCLELLMGIDGKHELHGLAAGALVDIEGPIGRFMFPSETDERRFVFIAAGTGIAPLRAMMREALAMSHREVLLLYSARTPDDFAYQEELDLMARHGRIQFRQTITRDDNHCGSWTGGRGRISVRELRPLVRDRATLWFICGPGAFVVDTVRLLQELGVTRERIVTEEWAVRPASLSNIATSDITRPAEHSKQDGLLV